VWNIVISSLFLAISLTRNTSHLPLSVTSPCCYSTQYEDNWRAMMILLQTIKSQKCLQLSQNGFQRAFNKCWGKLQQLMKEAKIWNFSCNQNWPSSIHTSYANFHCPLNKAKAHVFMYSNNKVMFELIFIHLVEWRRGIKEPTTKVNADVHHKGDKKSMCFLEEVQSTTNSDTQSRNNWYQYHHIC
jgi:hypothetical protein